MATFIATLATMTVFSLTLVITDGNPITNLNGSYAFQLFGRGFLGIPVPAVTMFITFIIYILFYIKRCLVDRLMPWAVMKKRHLSQESKSIS